MRHRRFLVSAIVLLALAAGGVAAGRVTQSPIVATTTLGSTTYLPSPVVDGRSGHAFFVTGTFGQSTPSEAVRMLDTRDGRMVRTLKMPWFNNGLGIGGVDERAGRLYVVAGAVTGNNVFLFDTKTGKRVAATHIDDPGADLLVDAAAGRVYVVGYTSPACTNSVCTEYDGTLSTLDARTGKLLHSIHLARVGSGLMAVDPRMHHLIIESGLYASRAAISLYDTRTGRRVRQVKLPAGSSAYVQPDSLDETTGRMYLIVVRPGAQRTSSGNQGPPPRYAIGIFDTRAGRFLHTLTATGNPIDVTLQPSVPYIALTAFGPWRTVTITSHDVNGGTETATLTSPTGPGRLELRDRRTLSLLRAVTVAPGAIGAAIDARRGRVYVLSSGAVDPTTGQIGPGTVSVVDASSGRVLRTLAVGMDVMALTLDAQAGRLLVSHSPSYIPIVAPDPWGWIPRQVRRRLPFIPQTAPRPRRMPAQLTIIDTGRL